MATASIVPYPVKRFQQFAPAFGLRELHSLHISKCVTSRFVTVKTGKALVKFLSVQVERLTPVKDQPGPKRSVGRGRLS